MRPLFSHLSTETAKTYGLVLTSAAIPHQVNYQPDKCSIAVPRYHRRAAITVVSLYLRENPTPSLPDQPPTVRGHKTFSAFFIVPFLAIIHALISPGYEHRVFVETFGADAEQILRGDIYRCITALFLHQDWPHVVNNMVGLALFGTVAASISGWGVGWLMILFAGLTGNLITALWYQNDHISIGASTAVFGALGLCIALNLWLRARGYIPFSRIWLPVAGGLALLGLLGTSPHTDLMAHLSGFGCGVLVGGVYGWISSKPQGLAVQLAAAISAFATIVLCWAYGGYCS